MKEIIIFIASVVIAVSPLPRLEPPLQEPVVMAVAVEEIVTVEPLKIELTCREAIAATWPPELQDGAITVLTHENRSENVAAQGKPNKDGSIDYGCFQINSYWHKPFFENYKWDDAKDNAEYAYKIYQGRQAREGNGWRAWYAVQGILF